VEFVARAMTPEERRSFLMRGTRTAILATIRPDGRPHAVPVGFVLDGDDVLFLTGERTVKGANLQHDPRVSLVVDDETPPFAFVRIDGRAEVSQARDEVRRAAAIEIGRRYGGGESVDEFVRFADIALGLLVRVRPTHVVALDRVHEH
jgi:PPOX class probable F420-dependent enzyme